MCYTLLQYGPPVLLVRLGPLSTGRPPRRGRDCRAPGDPYDLFRWEGLGLGAGGGSPSPLAALPSRAGFLLGSRLLLSAPARPAGLCAWFWSAVAGGGFLFPPRGLAAPDWACWIS